MLLTPSWWPRWLRLGRRLAPPISDQDSIPMATFFAGKGGVGKTTCAAAWAVQRANPEHSVLLVSTDPAHSLGDLLQRRLGDEASRVLPGLDVMEIAPQRALDRYLAEVKHNLSDLVSPELRSTAERQVDLAAATPGAMESALFDAIVSVLLDHGAGHAEVVFDTAPSGHTLALLQLPEQMAAWTEAMLDRRQQADRSWSRSGSTAAEDRAAAVLERRRRRYQTVRDRLLDPAHARIIPVLNPDALALAESARMIDALQARGMAIPVLIINRVLPAEAEDSFLGAVWHSQQRHLETMAARFADLPRWPLPQQHQEILGIDLLRTLPLPKL